jgi:hypothetical protein
VADHDGRLRPDKLPGGRGGSIDEPPLERPAERFPVKADLRRPGVGLGGEHAERMRVGRRTAPQASQHRGGDQGRFVVVSDLPERSARVGALDQQRVPLAVDLAQAHRALTMPVHERIGLVGGLFLRKVELEHGLTSVRERGGHGQRHVTLPEGLAETERPLLRTVLCEPRQRLQPGSAAGAIAPPAQLLGNLDQRRSLAMKKPLVPCTSGRVSRNSGRFGWANSGHSAPSGSGVRPDASTTASFSSALSVQTE